MEEQFTISIFVNNKPGVLVRISQTFARRGYNVESLVVSAAHDPQFSRMTVVVQGNPADFDQILRQLNKLVDVVHASHHESSASVDREMALFKVEVSVCISFITPTAPEVDSFLPIFKNSRTFCSIS